MSIEDVKKAHQSRKGEVERKRAENDLLSRQISKMEESILKLVDNLQMGQEAAAFLEELANTRRGAMKGKIESVVSEALKLVYGDSYKVELSYGTRAGRSSLEIEMVRDTTAGEVRRDMGGFGGGVADTISVPMRLMVLVGSRQTDKVCVLDECWKHVNPERIEAVGRFLRALAEKLGMQVVMCTHHQALQAYADRIYRVSESGGKSRVEAS